MHKLMVPNFPTNYSQIGYDYEPYDYYGQEQEMFRFVFIYSIYLNKILKILKIGYHF